MFAGYNPTKPKTIRAKEKNLNAVEKLLNNRQEVIDAFKTGIFPYIDGFQKKEKTEEESEEESEEELEAEFEKIKDDFKKFIEYIENESKDMNYDLFKEHFDFVVPSVLAKCLDETKDKKKNDELLKIIKSRWSDLKDEIKNMSESGKEIEQPNKILKIVE